MSILGNLLFVPEIKKFAVVDYVDKRLFMRFTVL